MRIVAAALALSLVSPLAALAGESIEQGAEEAGDAVGDAVDETGDEVSKAGKEAKEDASDGWITSKIKSRYAADSLVEARDVHVGTDDRTVTLTGKVKSEAARERAVSIAEETDGVVEVRDELVIEAKQNPSRERNPVATSAHFFGRGTSIVGSGSPCSRAATAARPRTADSLE